MAMGVPSSLRPIWTCDVCSGLEVICGLDFDFNGATEGFLVVSENSQSSRKMSYCSNSGSYSSMS